MTRRPLFEIVSDLLQQIAAAEGEVTDAIESLDLELQDKTEAYCVVIRQLEAEGEAYNNLAHEYALKSGRRNEAADNLRQRLAGALQRAGVEKMTTPTAKAWFATSTQVRVDDEATFSALADERFWTVETKVNRRALKTAMDAGEVIPGATLVTNRYLRIG